MGRIVEAIAGKIEKETFDEKDVDTLFRVIDADGSGKIDREEWKKRNLDEDSFDQCDHDKNGTIDKAELKATLNSMKRQLAKMLREADPMKVVQVTQDCVYRKQVKQ